MSTLFPPDPTLTVENVSHIMEKVEPKVKILVWNSVLEHRLIEPMTGKRFSFKEEFADIYVNCNPWASWEGLAISLFYHYQVAAVEKVRSYLPPRGQPPFYVHHNKIFIGYTVGVI